jgi:hypothetical protein
MQGPGQDGRSGLDEIMQIRRFRVSVVVVAVCCMTLNAASFQDADSRSHGRALETYESVLDRVLPLEPATDRVSPATAIWQVRLRIVPTWDPEMACTLTSSQDGRLIGTATIITGDRIFKQLEQLYRKQDAVRLDEASSRISQKTYTVNSGDCPRLTAVGTAFAKLQVPVVPSDVLAMDATRYDLVSRNSERTLRLSITAPEPVAVVEWAELARQVVTGCAPR